MNEKHGVVIVGGGIMGVCAAYYLAGKGRSVVLLDQSDIPNQRAASGDHLRVFRLSYGKDEFYTSMAHKTLPLWLELNTITGEKLLVQNGVLEFAPKAHGYEEDCFKVLKDMKIPVRRLEKKEIQRSYPMINTRAMQYAILHPDGGMLWAQRAVGAISALAQRKGAKFRTQTKVVAVLKDKKHGIKGVKDAAGKVWEAEQYLFASGAWNAELLKGLPIKVTRQFQMYVRPPFNRGRYRPEHFPVFASLQTGFYGFPLHIHGFLKVGDHKKGPPGKPGKDEATPPAFEKKVRAFFKRFIPELAAFTEFEGAVCYYDNTKDGDFIVDRLPDAQNAFVLGGFSGHGFKFGPLIGKTIAELMLGGKPELNLHRFRIGRFKKG